MSIPKILTVALFIKNGENFSNKEKYFMANPAGCFLFMFQLVLGQLPLRKITPQPHN